MESNNLTTIDKSNNVIPLSKQYYRKNKEKNERIYEKLSNKKITNFDGWTERKSKRVPKK